MTESNNCIKPLEQVIQILGRKWTIPLVMTLGAQEVTQRYSEIRESLDGKSDEEISDSTLSKKLSELTGMGLISRTSYDEVPPRVEYRLTEAGMALYQTLSQIADWTRDQCHVGSLRIRR